MLLKSHRFNFKILQTALQVDFIRILIKKMVKIVGKSYIFNI